MQRMNPLESINVKELRVYQKKMELKLARMPIRRCWCNRNFNVWNSNVEKSYRLKSFRLFFYLKSKAHRKTTQRTIYCQTPIQVFEIAKITENRHSHNFTMLFNIILALLYVSIWPKKVNAKAFFLSWAIKIGAHQRSIEPSRKVVIVPDGRKFVSRKHTYFYGSSPKVIYLYP